MSSPTAPAMAKVAESGILQLEGAMITYTSANYGSFAMRVSEVAVVGEFTTDNGPFIDDWFLVFVRRGGEEWFEASMCAEGVDVVLEQLASSFRSPLHVGLAHSTDFASRIIWPSALEGRPLFTFSRVRGSTVLRRLLHLLVPEISRCLSPEAVSATS